MSAGAVHNPTPFTLTDSDVRLVPAPPHFPSRVRQKQELKERTRETLSRTESTSIAESIVYSSFYGEVKAKIPFKHVAKTAQKNAEFASKCPVDDPVGGSRDPPQEVTKLTGRRGPISIRTRRPLLRSPASARWTVRSGASRWIGG